jgi:hypothetical protein
LLYLALRANYSNTHAKVRLICTTLLFAGFSGWLRSLNGRACGAAALEKVSIHIERVAA